MVRAGNRLQLLYPKSVCNNGPRHINKQGCDGSLVKGLRLLGGSWSQFCPVHRTAALVRPKARVIDLTPRLRKGEDIHTIVLAYARLISDRQPKISLPGPGQP